MTKIDRLLVDCGPGETRVAALDGERVIEVFHNRTGLPDAGALYHGRVGAPLPDKSAVFVEIGLDRPAFMPCGAKPLPEGTYVSVSVVQPPRGEKGAKVRLSEAAANTALENELSSSALDSSKPGLIRPAQHPIAWCAETYTETLKRVVVAPRDRDGSIAAMLGPDIKLEAWSEVEDLFEQAGVEDSIERALDPVVPLPGGGSLIIESTAALTAVDVDAGPMAAAEANRVALNVLADELRLRAIAGPVIVDLIPTRGRKGLVDQFKQWVADDPVPTQVAGLTPEGRIEFNRRRLRPSLADALLETARSPSPAIDAVAYAALRQCVRTGLRSNATSLTLRAHKDVIALLQTRLRPALDEAESALKIPLTLDPAAGVERGWTDIVI